MSITLSNNEQFPDFDGEGTLIIKFVDSTPTLEFNDGSGWEPFGGESYTESTFRLIQSTPGIAWRVANIGNSVIKLVAYKSGKLLE